MNEKKLPQFARIIPPGFRELFSYYFYENPAPQNVPAVTAAFDRLAQYTRRTREPNEEFETEISLDLSLRNGKTHTFDLTFEMYGFDAKSNEVLPYAFELGLWLHNKQAAWTCWFTEIVSDSELGHYVLVQPKARTVFGREGNGFGQALGFQTEAVIGFAIEHMNVWGNMPVICRVRDASYGKMHGRTDWTTSLALHLGYTHVGGNEFEKRFR